MKQPRVALTYALLLVAVLLAAPCRTSAQTAISGDIAGTVYDPSGAVVPGATVTLKSTTTGEVRTVKSGSNGFYRAPLLKPDTYVLSVSAPGFGVMTSTIVVQVGQVENGDEKLPVSGTSESVSVNSGSAPMLQTESGSIATSFSKREIENLPNPGGDVTYTAETAPGIVMNTRPSGTTGVGDFSAFGMPGLSNIFTLNGGNENDPFNNTFLVGAFNMIVGNNDVEELSVVNNGSAEYGDLAGSQINAISKSGSNAFHGNANYGWNGRLLNANDYFNKLNGVPRAFDNFNQWSASVGGPIWKNRTFFFADYEGLREVLPTSSQVIVPSPTFQALALASVPAAQVGFYQQMFAIYNAAPGVSRATPVTGNTDIDQFQSTVPNFQREFLVAARVDHKLTSHDQLFAHVRIDHGVQIAYTDPLSSAFNLVAPEPINEGQLNETHVFSTSIVNSLLLTLMHYSAKIPTNTAGGALFPGTMSFGGTLPLNTLGGEDYASPEGRNTTAYSFIDDVLFTKRSHSLKAGASYRRIDTSDFNLAEESVLPLYSSESRADFLAGRSTSFTQVFPQKQSEPLAQYMLGIYIQDAWKVRPSFTVTGGLRVEHYSNPVCQTNCIARFVPNTTLAGQSSTTAYNQLINVGLHQTLAGYQAASYEPRFAFAWSPLAASRGLVVRGAVGFFTSYESVNLGGSLLNNIPVGPSFSVVEANLTPAVTGSAVNVAATSDAAFASGFASGGSYSSISAAVATAGGSFSAPSFTNTNPGIKYPTYEEWNIGIEQALGPTNLLGITYVGNHGYHETYTNTSENAYVTNPAFFTGLPTTRPSLSFGSVKYTQSDASSNYNGLVLSARHISRLYTASLNYTWSHALDEVSNNGLSSANNATSIATIINPSNFAQANYGNSDYDVRHYLNGTYAIMSPRLHGWRTAASYWTLSGSVFATSGRPFTVTDTTTSSSYTKYYGGTLPAAQVAYHSVKCTGAAVKTPCLGTAPVRGSSVATNVPGSIYAFASGFGLGRRNQAYGPNYVDTDLSLMKNIPIPRLKEGKLTLGASFFNLLNHPNFAAPGHDVNNSAQLGKITNTVGTPTSIVGTNLGGDSSPRMIELVGKFTF